MSAENGRGVAPPGPDRPIPGPVQEQAEIFSMHKVGAYTEFTVVAPGIAAGFRPGHFIAVGVGGENTGMILRRAFAIAAVSTPGSGGAAGGGAGTPGAGFAGTVRFVVAPNGPGTRWIVQRQVGERLDIVGPLGTPFPLPAEPKAAVLVGGGYGAAPLLPLAARLQAAGSQVEIILGAATAERLYAELAAKRLVGSVTVTTDDGTAGTKGRVTDELPSAIERIGAEVVYACGPMGMLKACGEVAAAKGIRAQVSVEEAMACGIGVCMTCVLPVRGTDGRSRFLRSCVDGPCFDAQAVRWDEVGTLPADLVGADAMSGH